MTREEQKAIPPYMDYDVRTEVHAADAKKAGVITSYTRTTRLTLGEWQGTL